MMQKNEHAELRVTYVPLVDLHPDPKNARLHDARNLEAIRASVEQFGPVEPLVIQGSTMKVIGGNGRLEVYAALGMSDAPCVVLDVDDMEATALGLALNRTSELAAWDFGTLATLAQGLRDEGFGTLAAGWTDDEIAPLLAADWSPPSLDPDFDPDVQRSSTRPIKLTAEQRDVFDKVCAKMELEVKREGEAIIALCMDYLAQ